MPRSSHTAAARGVISASRCLRYWITLPYLNVRGQLCNFVVDIFVYDIFILDYQFQIKINWNYLQQSYVQRPSKYSQWDECLLDILFLFLALRAGLISVFVAFDPSSFRFVPRRGSADVRAWLSGFRSFSEIATVVWPNEPVNEVCVTSNAEI